MARNRKTYTLSEANELAHQWNIRHQEAVRLVEDLRGPHIDDEVRSTLRDAIRLLSNAAFETGRAREATEAWEAEWNRARGF